MAVAGDIKRVLIVDREIAAAEAIRQTLSEGGFSVSTMTDSLAVLAAVCERPPDLVLIDWDMPGSRAAGSLPSYPPRVAPTEASGLIILSAFASEQDVVCGLSLGADDYIAKPFSLREVLARSRAVLRLRGQERETAPLSCDELVLDSVDEASDRPRPAVRLARRRISVARISHVESGKNLQSQAVAGARVGGRHRRGRTYGGRECSTPA